MTRKATDDRMLLPLHGKMLTHASPFTHYWGLPPTRGGVVGQGRLERFIVDKYRILADKVNVHTFNA